jgi:hypothetical protein
MSDRRAKTEKQKYKDYNPEGDMHELLQAYRNLFSAVENGTIDEDFFKLREEFRRVTARVLGDK